MRVGQGIEYFGTITFAIRLVAGYWCTMDGILRDRY